MNTKLSLSGIGLRTAHQTELLEKRPPIAWLEVHSENFFAEGGKALDILQKIRQHYPISLHGVSLSLGSSDELNWQHLKKLQDLIQRIDPCLVSEHLSWSSINGRYFNDLLPLPYTEESLQHMIERVEQVQDFLKRQIIIENISSYCAYPSSTIPEWEFLQQLANQSGCGILLDINNIYVSATNLHFDPQTYLRAISPDSVQEIHLGGFSTAVIEQQEVLIDTHSRPVVPAVWDLFRQAVRLYGIKPTMIEWDKDLPSLETLYLEAYRAEQIMGEAYAATKFTV